MCSYMQMYAEVYVSILVPVMSAVSVGPGASGPSRCLGWGVCLQGGTAATEDRDREEG